MKIEKQNKTFELLPNLYDCGKVDNQSRVKQKQLIFTDIDKYLGALVEEYEISVKAEKHNLIQFSFWLCTKKNTVFP